MKKRFTRKSAVAILALVVSAITVVAQDVSTGTGWGELNPGESLVINQNFQGFEFFHSDDNPDQGNSDHAMDEFSGEIIYNYKDMDVELDYEGSNIKYGLSFTQCAFAPEWSTAYAYKNESQNTDDVSDGFVEISRNDEIYSQIPTTRGHMRVDLTGLESVEIIQYSHSSTGGSKRGIMVEFSIDSGETWDTLRYQPGENYTGSFTRDPFTNETQTNTYRCDPSAYGMKWEDAIYWYDGGFMLRFTDSAGQTVRVHDLKVYGTLPENTGVDAVADELHIRLNGRKLVASMMSDVKIYSITGAMVKRGVNEKSFDLRNLKNGVYIVEATSGQKIATEKIVLK
ncbi:MAG: T9SS type A sorting domain-containing protein [Prolixibacteraceae bacterium]|jgi:hypothetical protein|nr:T9SS type A sorting domain-containing protein [Prolixibacteraceae bacterium]